LKYLLLNLLNPFLFWIIHIIKLQLRMVENHYSSTIKWNNLLLNNLTKLIILWL
jgi:hypothetical protein